MELNKKVAPAETICNRKEDAKKLICEIIDKLEILEGYGASITQENTISHARIAKLGYCDVSHATSGSFDDWVVYDNSNGVSNRFLDLLAVAAFILKRWW